MLTDKKKILLVDDDKAVSESVKSILEETEKYEVRTFANARGVFSLARAYQPDLVVLDISMPYKDGSEIAAELQSDPKTAAIKIIFLTAIVTPDEARGQTQSGGIPVLAKPVNVMSFLACVDKLLRY